MYTANAYLVTGTWKTLDDLNTLVDAGMDPLVVEHLEKSNNGVGKKKLDQIILTHGHYDHAGMVQRLKEVYKPVVMAFSESQPLVDRYLRDGEHLRMGDADFEVIHMPGHSNDSICLYSRSEEVLFAGDSPLIINNPAADYDEPFIRVLDRLARLPIQTIFFGHGAPMINHCSEVLKRSLFYAKKTNTGGYEA